MSRKGQIIKQFMVTNCKVGAVTKTLKYRILIPIDTSKESYSYDDFHYINFIKFSPNHQKL